MRDIFANAGIDDSRLVLSKPVQEAANISGEDPVARRVEVTITGVK